jgi:hypothetical protein
MGIGMVLPVGLRSGPLHRVHIHLLASDVGAPSIPSLEPLYALRGEVTADRLADAVETLDATLAAIEFEVTDDRIEQAARAKFAADGWTVVEDDTHDMDIAYDGEVYLIEAWVY